jgi:acetyl esterase/lipase
MYGDSAGGGLAAAATLKLRDAGGVMPGALVLWAPWSDVTETGDTYHTLRGDDPKLVYEGNLEHCANAYANPSDHKHAHVSPVYGDYSKGFPPTLIQVGTKDILLSCAVRQYQAIQTAGGDATLDVYEGMPHVFQPALPESPESKQAMKRVQAFLEAQWE